MDRSNEEGRLRALRQVPTIPKGDDFAVIDELEAAQHLLRAGIMACESIEAMDERNALVSLLDEIGRRIATCTNYLKVVDDGQK